MSTLPDPVLRIPRSVREDVLAFRGKVEAHLRGEIQPVAFKAYRVPMGIYEQRMNGRFMVRVRLGAGIVLPHQLTRIANLSTTYGNGTVHVTTRQDVQIHDVSLESTPDILEGLLEADLTSRGGGGNTVRNVSACPRSGSCPHERFDVAPYALATAEYLLQHRSSFNLPRKYKIAFSGCGQDCALASVTDLGFFAQIQEGEPGFSAFAGGGLGMHPRGGVQIEGFVRPEQILDVAEAIRRVFDRHGDRTNKHRARLRYVLERVGEEEFKELYRKEVDLIRSEGLAGDRPAMQDLAARFRTEPRIQGQGPRPDDSHKPEYSFLLPERDLHLATIRLALPLGDVAAAHLLFVTQAAAIYGQGFVRTTQLQEILVPGVPWTRVSEAVALLEPTGLVEENLSRGPRIVACAGASTCKLGLCQSRRLAEALASQLNTKGLDSSSSIPVVRISGCPNSCGGHHVADIGLEGRAERHNGRLLPAYSVLVGGCPSEEGARLALPVGAVPAKCVPELLTEVLSGGSVEPKRFRELVVAYGSIPPDPPEEYFRDLGDNEPFSLAGRGPGECGAGVFDVIQVDINDAERALESARTALDADAKSETLYTAILAAARSLLLVFGHEAQRDREIFSTFDRDLVETGWVHANTRELIHAAIDWRMDSTSSLADFETRVAELVTRVKTLFSSLDANLEFRVSRMAPQEPTPMRNRDLPLIARVDFRGVPCPMNFVKTKVALDRIPVGGLLEVVLDDGDPIRNVPASLTEQGQDVLAIESFEGQHVVRIRRTR